MTNVALMAASCQTMHDDEDGCVVLERRLVDGDDKVETDVTLIRESKKSPGCVHVWRCSCKGNDERRSQSDDTRCWWFLNLEAVEQKKDVGGLVTYSYLA